MKTLICGLAVSLGVMTNSANAEQMLNVGGIEYPMSVLMDNCKAITDQPAAQIACFNNIVQLLDEQSGGQQEEAVSVPDALEAFKAVTQYQDDDSGLQISGADCRIHIVYFNNYFHISRRNISSIDLFSAEFDASKLQYDQIVGVQGAKAPLSKGVLAAGATAAVRGGVALESSQQNFAPKTPRASIGDYANEIVGQLPARESQAFEFVLIHPKRNQASAEIWGAFEAFVNACNRTTS